MQLKRHRVKQKLIRKLDLVIKQFNRLLDPEVGQRLAQGCKNPFIGGISSYRKGCRCVSCVEAKRADRKAWRSTEAGRESCRRSHRRWGAKDPGNRKKAKHVRREKDKLPEFLGSRGDLKPVMDFKYEYVETHVDHVLPLKYGGVTHAENLCVLTAYENSVIKSGHHPYDLYYCTVPLAGVYRYEGAWLDVEIIED